MQARRPLTAANAHDAADDLDGALDHNHDADEHDHPLEGPYDRAVGAGGGMLVHAPRELGKAVARVDEREHAGEKEEDIEHEVHQRLAARRPGAIDEVAAHMRV